MLHVLSVKLIVKYFLTDILFWGFVLDLKKFISPSQTFFFWKGVVLDSSRLVFG